MVRFIEYALLAIIVFSSSTKAADTDSSSCDAQDQYHQLDFAMGHWDIYEEGHKSAEAQLIKDLAGCAIRLTWTPASPLETQGLGLFTYSQALKRWSYFWVTDHGQTSYSLGKLRRPADMQFITERRLPGGAKRTRKWGLTRQPDGTIQELSIGTDDRRHWSVEFDLLWRKHP